MALTRRLLKGMNLTEEQMDTIIEAHTDTVDGLKTRIGELEGQVENLPALQKKVEQLESDLQAAENGGWKDKHDAVKKEFDEYKAGIAAKDARAAKEKAVRAYLEGKNIRDKNLTIAMLALNADIDALEMDGDSIKDTKALDDKITGDLAGLVTVSSERGAPPPANPPANTGGRMKKEDIYAMKNPAERQRAIYENRDLFGI